jgi:hypothetical protein
MITKTAAAPAAARTRRVLTSAVASMAGAAALAMVISGAFAGAASASTKPAATATAQTNCSATPSACGFPDATNTGLPAGTTLKTVPTQVSSGPGWSYNSAGWVEVTGNGANLTGLYIPYNVDIEANNVTLNDDEIVNTGNFGVSLRNTSGVTIENSTISGQNATTGEVDSAIDDIYGNSTGLTIKNNNISLFKSAIQVSAGLITGNYIHNPGYQSGDHTNGIIDNGSTQALTISDNTILNNLNQTDAIILDSNSANSPVANKTITGNLLGGGSYAIYAGATLGNTTSNIVIENNRFSQLYYSTSGQYGAAAYYNPSGTGNVWSGNVWDTTGQTVAAP